jgi:hypothetical protein
MTAAFSVFRVKHTPLDPAHPKARPPEEKGVNTADRTTTHRSDALESSFGRVAFLEEDP